MRGWQFVLLVAVATLPSSGCSTLMAIDQWKCDNWGCCMPWVRPSNACAPAWESTYLQPNDVTPGIVGAER